MKYKVLRISDGVKVDEMPGDTIILSTNSTEAEFTKEVLKVSVEDKKIKKKDVHLYKVVRVW